MAAKAVSPAKKVASKVKAAPVKKTVSKNKVVPAKKSITKAASRKQLNKGDALVCGTCGFSIVVDELGDVIAAEEIICCGKPMKPKAKKAKVAAK